MRTHWVWPAVIAVSAGGAIAVVFTDSPPVIRSLVVLWFFLLCPGMAYVRLLHVRDVLLELTLAIALSIVLGAVVAMTMLYMNVWSPQWGVVALAIVSLVGVALQLVSAEPGRSLSQGAAKNGDESGVKHIS